MKVLVPSLVVLLIVSGCVSGGDTPKYTRAEMDSIERVYDSLMSADPYDQISSSITDTSGLYLAPIKIVEASIIEEYGSRNIRLKYKNVSSVHVSAVRFRWTGVNAFGEPADMGNSFIKGFGAGFSDDGIKPNQVLTGEWGIYSEDAKKVLMAWPYEIVFENGDKWELNPE